LFFSVVDIFCTKKVAFCLVQQKYAHVLSVVFLF
jgi:hypothetical protein